jgi:O-antigen ligase
VLVMASIVLAGSLLLGGGTRSGFLADVVLQLSSIPLVLLVLWRYLVGDGAVPGGAVTGAGRFAGRPRLELLVSAAIIAVPVAQLIPMPPAAWERLPGQSYIASAFEVVGRSGPGWVPLSLAPSATMLGILSLLPPIALFLAIGWLGYRERRILSLVALLVGIASVLLGLLQVAQGETSQLRPFEFTNLLDAVGFFANRNHFASLIYCLLLLAAAWTVEASARASRGEGLERFNTSNIAVLLAAFTVLLVLVAGQSMTRSRAGVIITILAMIPAFAIALADRRSISGLKPIQVMVGAGALAMLFSVQFALYRLLQRFEADPLADARVPFARNTISAAREFMPFGSGVGSFVPVYGVFERPEDTLTTFANRAHNDVLELWLETGLPGMIVAVGLGALFVVGTIRIWWRPSVAAKPIDRALARAASGIIILLIAHSFVDYPLRTGAMMAIFALAGGFMISPVPRGKFSDWRGASAVTESEEPAGERVPSQKPKRRIDPQRHASAPAHSVDASPTRPGQVALPRIWTDRASAQGTAGTVQWPSAEDTDGEGDVARPTTEEKKAEMPEGAGVWRERDQAAARRSAARTEEPDWPEEWRNAGMPEGNTTEGHARSGGPVLDPKWPTARDRAPSNDEPAPQTKGKGVKSEESS